MVTMAPFSWTISSADNHHVITSSVNFYRLAALPDDQPTLSKYQRQFLLSVQLDLVVFCIVTRGEQDMEIPGGAHENTIVASY